MDMQTLTTFFGWCAVVNFGVLTFSAIMLIVFKGMVVKIHSALMGVSSEGLSEKYFEWLGNYKIATFIFSVVPWIALKIMA